MRHNVLTQERLEIVKRTTPTFKRQKESPGLDAEGADR